MGQIRSMFGVCCREVSKLPLTKPHFESWEALPDLALLSIKHHQEEGKRFLHWVVFKRGRPTFRAGFG